MVETPGDSLATWAGAGRWGQAQTQWSGGLLAFCLALDKSQPLLGPQFPNL